MSQPFWDNPLSSVFDGIGLVSDSPVDIFVLNGSPLPGIAKVSGKRRKRTDKKKAAGKDRHTPTHLGYDAAEVTVKLTLWTPAQWESFQALIPTIQPKPGKGNPKPFAVYHPFLAAYGITALYMEDISLPVSTGRQIFEVTLTMTEFNPADTGSIETNKKLQPKDGNVAGGSVRKEFKQGLPNYAPTPVSKPPSSGNTGP